MKDEHKPTTENIFAKVTDIDVLPIVQKDKTILYYVLIEVSNNKCGVYRSKGFLGANDAYDLYRDIRLAGVINTAGKFNIKGSDYEWIIGGQVWDIDKPADLYDNLRLQSLTEVRPPVKKEKLNLSADRVYDNLVAYLKRHPDKFEVAEVATYGNTIVIADWNKKEPGPLYAFITSFYSLKGIDTGHSDEYRRCDECSKFVCTNDTASSDYVATSDGDFWCDTCCINHIDGLIEERMNVTDRAWHQFLGTEYLTDRGWRLCNNCDDKQCGMHMGMNDDPQSVVDDFCGDNNLSHINDEYNFIFVVKGSNPFMVNFSMWVKEI